MKRDVRFSNSILQACQQVYALLPQEFEVSPTALSRAVALGQVCSTYSVSVWTLPECNMDCSTTMPLLARRVNGLLTITRVACDLAGKTV